MKKLKQGDEVIVISGKNKGAIGVLSKLFDNGKVLVSGVNLVKKHQKGNPNSGIAGGIIDKEMPVHISNVAIYNPKIKKADKVGFKYLDNNKKVRFYK